MKTETNLREFLKNELISRINKNASYSLRAFAKSLKIHPSTLSQILNGTRPITTSRKNAFIKVLALGPNELRSIENGAQYSSNYSKLEIDKFNVISDWYFDAILELTHLQNFKGDPRWIARKLGLNLNKIKLAIETLCRLQLLEIKNGIWIDSRMRNTVGFDSDFTNTAMKKYQQQLLELSRESITELDPPARQHRSFIFSVDEKEIDSINKKICDFLYELMDVVNKNSSKRTMVNMIQISHIPLTKNAEEQI